MTRNTLACSLLALSLLAGPTAMAQNPNDGRRDDRQRSGPSQRDNRDGRYDRDDRGNRYDRGSRSDRDDRRFRDPRDPRDSRWSRVDNDRRDRRGAGPGNAYYRGDRLPPVWRQRSYVVTDWRGHRLSSSPRGYHWVQHGGDYLLVAITTGVILQLLLMGD